MLVSGAYAWTKGNHIDDQVARICQKHNVDFQIKKAGYTWEYLQLTLNKESETFMLIIKAEIPIKNIFNGKKSKDKNYLKDLADVNLDFIKENKLKFVNRPEQVQLELNSPAEIKAVMTGGTLKTNYPYSRFYVVTYSIDEKSKLIDSIYLTFPNSSTMDLIPVENLTRYISISDYEITPDDVEPIKDEKEQDGGIFSGPENSFGFAEIKEDKKSKSRMWVICFTEKI